MGGRAPHEGAGGRAPHETGTEHVVLVVDGDADVRSHVAMILERAALAAVCVADGAAALRLVASDRVRPAVLLTEIELVGMSGVELAARASSMRPRLRVVMMTADPIRAEAARAHSSIVATVLLKPLDAAELMRAVGPDASAAVH